MTATKYRMYVYQVCEKCGMSELDASMAGFIFGHYGDDYGWRCEHHAP